MNTCDVIYSNYFCFKLKPLKELMQFFFLKYQTIFIIYYDLVKLKNKNEQYSEFINYEYI